MDLKTITLIVGANLLAIAVGLQRLDSQGLIRLDTFIPYQLLGQPCGLARDDFFAIVSNRIVLPTGIVSGAGRVVTRLAGGTVAESVQAGNHPLHACRHEDSVLPQ